MSYESDRPMRGSGVEAVMCSMIGYGSRIASKDRLIQQNYERFKWLVF